MNKMFLIVLAPGFFYFSNLAAIADKLVRFPEGNAAWMIEITPLVGAVDLGSGTGKKAQKVEIVQADNMKKIVITWNNGTSTEKWAVSNLPVTFKAAPDGTVYPVGNGRVEDLMDNMAAPINPSEFSWITSDNLQEKDPVSYEGTMARHRREREEKPGLTVKLFSRLRSIREPRIAYLPFYPRPTPLSKCRKSLRRKLPIIKPSWDCHDRV
jgi:hypothetical protein